MKKIFEAKVIQVGPEAQNMIQDANMLILFGEEAPEGINRAIAIAAQPQSMIRLMRKLTIFLLLAFAAPLRAQEPVRLSLQSIPNTFGGVIQNILERI